MIASLYGVSLGPGDPGLITRKAWELLHSGAEWTYPVRKKQGKSYALNIALQAGLTPPENHTELVFPMTHDREILAKYWLRAAEQVLSKLQAGNDVVFLVEGDASTYSTFQHLAKTVAALDASIIIETIAGVSSFNAAAARAKIPLADTDDTVAIIPAGYGIAMIEKMLHDFDTLILLKVKPLLDDILELLEHKNLLTQSCFIEKAGSNEERIVRDVMSLKGQKVNYLSLLMVHNSHRIREELIRGCRKK
ncbi:precorrin-2/cobalt-factor-2 C20-methyltransferase [Bathymodiolus japonicus methanotrophic gill symbiont]|uniref:precorrin-2 C(20)-methyltransferase n=1 Tax=Bathymodiolus japonicus methanotrophic gill symbiont TaxID=113269 RepID=UPI001B4B46A1|nr:precorrin-2 C(20)-methyltransferase [Bathymodiolus japonicus methanotrophic gill symbiont]GFO71370.1 precorrin-2/cobalt-factor-2 C20-methyltransferase [Bathymodiolus japonicus methanotrophic gill symbiont]